MILYLDASALVKRYIAELGTPEVAAAIREADVVGTSIISRVETAAALAKAVRTQTLSQDEAASALQVFRSEWPNLVRVQATETLVARADIHDVRRFAERVEIGGTLKVVGADPDDDKFIECAVVGQADVIASGDSHLLDLEEYQGIPIMSAGDFIDWLAGRPA